MMFGFLLTRQWRDTPEGISLEFWWATDQGAVCTQITQQESVFFVKRKDAVKIQKIISAFSSARMAEVALKNFKNHPVNAIYCKQQRTSRELQIALESESIAFWEADIKPHERYLMERFINASVQIPIETIPANRQLLNPVLSPIVKTLHWRPNLRCLSIDIETTMDAKQLFSIAVYAENLRRVFMIGDKSRDSSDFDSTKFQIDYYRDEKTCLLAFLDFIRDYDPDILMGWNVIQFDLWVLEQIAQKHALNFRIGRAQENWHWRQEEGESGRRFVIIPGRIALDGIELLKAANTRFDSFSLQNVAEALLGKGKLLSSNQRGDDIQYLFEHDKQALAEYNLRDTELVWDIFQQEKLLSFAMERSQLTGLLMDRIGGSVAAFEYAYLPKLHRAGYVAPNLGEFESDVISPGGYVMNSRPGIYDNVLVLDFKSLYPSIMRSFLIDPCAFWLAQHHKLPDEKIVEGFNGAFFAREGHILPSIIEQLSAARDQAKKDKNAPLSHAIKIIMNSFYGVLGSTGCRFFDPRVCSSITLRGHEIIQTSRDWIEQQGYAVIYGDTDSLFVWLENNCQGKKPKNLEQCQKIGQRLARELNQWWTQKLQEDYQLKSALEIQFETHYHRFLMPTIRGSDLGTKKRYAGLIHTLDGEEIIFKGLESARSDWTPLAKQFQLALYQRIFAGENHVEFIREVAADLLQGKRDANLIYRKRLRQKLADYQKNIPPHVQAAKKYQQKTGQQLRRGDWIEYVITVNGPEAVECRESPLDYQHYLTKQLMPVADSILYFLQESMSSILETQLTLFE
jgi:DNA polymerase-2